MLNIYLWRLSFSYYSSSIRLSFTNFASYIYSPISPEIMDGFWCSRCLNNHIKVPDMMRLFAGGATTPLVVKILTKQPWVKIGNLRDFDLNFSLSRGKIWLLLNYNFICVMVLRFYLITKTVVKSSILLEMTWNFLCRILEP